jgi:hypothetical protein
MEMIRTTGMPDERRSGIVAPRWIDRIRLAIRPSRSASDRHPLTPVLRPSQIAMGRLAWLC